jgi:hypothetical protein
MLAASQKFLTWKSETLEFWGVSDFEVRNFASLQYKTAEENQPKLIQFVYVLWKFVSNCCKAIKKMGLANAEPHC